MKKIILFALTVLVLSSCSLKILDPEGWEIYEMGWCLDEDSILLQSHDGYVIDDVLYNETIINKTTPVHNCLNHEISVKVTYGDTVRQDGWIKIGPLSEYVIYNK